MSATRLKAKTTITEYEEQELSLRALEVLPEMLQVRANLDKGWSLQYSKDYAAGAAFPPILVYRLPDGRLVVTDGFHRVDACLAIGKKTIRAQIREGTTHEALLAAIEANTAAYHRGRPFGENDRRHAAEMMFADPECWLWSDMVIADRCGTHNKTVLRWRTEYKNAKGIEFPEKVIGPSGRWVPYKKVGVPNLLTVRPNKYTTSYRTIVKGKTVYLGTGREEAQKKLDAIVASRYKERLSLSLKGLDLFLANRGFGFRSLDFSTAAYPYVHGRTGHGVVLTVIRFDRNESVPWVIGCLQMFREISGDPAARMVAICYPENGPQTSIEVARKLGIEFLTPEELVESLKGAEWS